MSVSRLEGPDFSLLAKAEFEACIDNHAGCNMAFKTCKEALLKGMQSTVKQSDVKQSDVKQSDVKQSNVKQSNLKKTSETPANNLSTPAADLTNDVASPDFESPTTAEANTQHAFVHNPDKRYPGLITGHLPVELQLQIWSHLDIDEIARLARMHNSPLQVLSENTRAAANTIIERGIEQLFLDLHYFNFRNISLVEAWHRYSSFFSFQRSLDTAPSFHRLLQAYVDNNPNLDVFVDSNADLDDREDDVHKQMGWILFVSDWCRHYYNSTFYTEGVQILQLLGWEPALQAACGKGEELFPGAYGPLIEKWQDSRSGRATAGFIMLAFFEVRAFPLQDLRGRRAPTWIRDVWGAYAEGYRNPPVYSDNVVEVPEDVRQELVRRAVPELYNGFEVVVGTCTKRGKLLIEWMDKSDEPRGLMLMFADLMQELRIWWK